MRGVTAFVGDVHGNFAALVGIYRSLVDLSVDHIVFLGDYINKGSQSQEVVQQLVEWSAQGDITALKGNHESAMLDYIDTGKAGNFLCMGGAASIRSYVGGDVGPDVLADFLAHIPPGHLEIMREMPESIYIDGALAQHEPISGRAGAYSISAHMPVGLLPRILPSSAHLDTGCGSPEGRLTALLWPAMRYIQVDSSGVLLTN